LEGDEIAIRENIDLWVKEALDHYWGGPKLSENQLVNLKCVQAVIPLHENNPSNALRAVLKDCIEK